MAIGEAATAPPPNSQSAARKVLLVGASRGLGLGLAESFAAHDWHVVATERTASKRLRAAAAASGGRVRVKRVDINDPQQVQALHRQLAKELFDIIFIVAGISDSDPNRPVHRVAAEEAAQVFITNAYSPMCFAETFFNRLKPNGTLAVMTSRMGSLTMVSTATDGTWEVYRASKAALNMLARCFHQRHRDDARTLLLLHPGWVKTDMGGKDAPVELATSVEGLYGTLLKWQATGANVFLDYEGTPLPW
jgi:NAD(P)-dependent dehydrogenase (short-subunit alcohol dehydrogenase family)